jgi:hypothetical protein
MNTYTNAWLNCSTASVSVTLESILETYKKIKVCEPELTDILATPEGEKRIVDATEMKKRFDPPAPFGFPTTAFDIPIFTHSMLGECMSHAKDLLDKNRKPWIVTGNDIWDTGRIKRCFEAIECLFAELIDNFRPAESIIGIGDDFAVQPRDFPL